MSEPIERNQVIELLDKLGSEQDEDVLAAARMLHSQIIESGMGWEDLLVGDEPEGEEETQDDSRRRGCCRNGLGGPVGWR